MKDGSAKAMSGSSSTRRSLKIAILTSGRFHVLDLARELVALGHDVTFYSLLPPSRLTARRLDAKRGVWLGWGAGPFYALDRVGQRTRSFSFAADLTRRAIARTAALRLRQCDVFIGMSGMSLAALREAKRRFGAVTFLERASQHIVAQTTLLGLPVDSPIVRREIQEYEICDYLSIPSQHVLDSFTSKGLSKRKLIMNPLGVGLEEFPWSVWARTTDAPLRVIFVGNWSYQKGADIIERVAERFEMMEFVHVGPAERSTIRASERITSYDPVPQSDLKRWYADSDVLVLPSRQDGFGMVLTQALASGCHVIASDKTGGPDLAGLIADNNQITIIPTNDADALENALRHLETNRTQLREQRQKVPLWREKLSWAAYAKRYEAVVLQATEHTANEPQRPRATRESMGEET